MSITISTTPVVVDFAVASMPVNEVAQRLAADAAAQRAKLATGDKKAGTMRLLSTARGDLFQLNPYLIQIKDGWNSREAGSPENMEHVDQLARSIAEIGVQNPLTVVLEGDDAFVTDGHCRLLATFRAIEVYGAEIKSVPVRTESRFASAADHVLRQLLTGKPLSVVEQGNAFVKLVNLGWNAGDIAKKSGIGELRVNQILDFMADTTDVMKRMVIEGVVSANTVTNVLKDTGNTADAEEVLVDAVAIAQTEGRTKALPKHVRAAGGETRVSPVKTLRAVMGASSTVVDTTADDTVTITLSAADWRRIAEALKI